MFLIFFYSWKNAIVAQHTLPLHQPKSTIVYEWKTEELYNVWMKEKYLYEVVT